MKTPLTSLVPALVLSLTANALVDSNGNSQSDIWEMVNRVSGLDAVMDTDGDGSTNAEEAEAGTNPMDPMSRLSVDFNQDQLAWETQPGKVYRVERTQDLMAETWESIATFSGQGSSEDYIAEQASGTWFYRIVVEDVDSDGDGINDWEELQIGYDPNTTHSAYLQQADIDRIANELGSTNQLSIAAIDGSTSESWPDPAVFAIRRTGGLSDFEANFTISGNALNGSDYDAIPQSVSFSPGQLTAYVTISPIEDETVEADETVTLTLNPSADYTLGSPSTASVIIEDASTLPSAKEAARFLTQATFGPTPALIAEVQSLGIEGWIDSQFTQPVGELLPVLDTVNWGEDEGQVAGPYNHHKMLAWWEQAMRGPDPFRQRVGFAMSEIFVVSDNSIEIPRGMLNYYDTLLNNAFGNYRELIDDITYHPSMGVYLSHRGNQPPDPALNRFPDENYAREIMQLFSIGLWMLNNDGTQQLDIQGNPIPTYNNQDITHLARVFTGMSWGYGDTSVWWQFFWPVVPDGINYADYYNIPMTVWNGPFSRWNDELEEIEYFYHHDQDEKTILGVTLPANDPNNPETNYAVNDIDRALDVLFNHQNTGPFIAHALIQRMITSNPSPAYVGRVADAFNGNGPYNPSGIRGNLQAVMKAIFLDPEARSYESSQSPIHGKLRVPYLRFVAYSRAFNVTPPVDEYYEMYWISGDLGMQPMSSPSVFNFYLPTYQAPGPIKDLNLSGPEFQITTAVTGITLPNLFYSSTFWGYPAANDTDIDFTPAVALANDADALIDYLDGLMTYGNMSHETRSTIHYALNRPDTVGRSAEERAELAIYLVTVSPDYCVLR